MLSWGREVSRTMLEGGHLSSGFALGQSQLLEDNRSHLVSFRNRLQMARVKPILVLFLLEAEGPPYKEAPEI